MNRLRNITTIIGVLAGITAIATLTFAYSIATEIAAVITIGCYGLLSWLNVKTNNQQPGDIDNG